MMSRTDWMQEQRDAYNDLLEDGVMFTFIRKGKGAFDPIASSWSDGEEQRFAAPGIIMAISSPRNARMTELWQRQGTILQGDEMLLVGCGTYEPELEDRVDVNGAAWVVKGISSLRPGAVPLLNYLLVRRA